MSIPQGTPTSNSSTFFAFFLAKSPAMSNLQNNNVYQSVNFHPRFTPVLARF
jgi:hypothetical protein